MIPSNGCQFAYTERVEGGSRLLVKVQHTRFHKQSHTVQTKGVDATIVLLCSPDILCPPNKIRTLSMSSAS